LFMLKTKWIPVFLLCFVLTGCTTAESLIDYKGKGEGEVFVCTASYKRAYETAISTLKKRRLKILRKDKDKGYIIASDTIRLFNGGGRIAVYVYELGPSKTQIEVYSKPYFFIPTPTIYLAAHKRDIEIRDAIREAING